MKWYIKGLKNYTNFMGRASLEEYWMYILFYFLFLMGAFFIDLPFYLKGNDPIMTTIYILAFFLPTLAIQVRRLHDIGKSGWWVLIAPVPLIGPITLLVFHCLDSQPGENKYGPHPKATVEKANVQLENSFRL
ncbi:DUF805 domain-containing protein [Metabacillus malikii]|uniref:Uncharacterized membrane protein YhaH (DUF805 family) n=1 Tax=Metabacillus malikii TaxID=1504265 RepID=A0ABT9ZPI8_9BACI|nr:DUF805 domain-containing protein [Metabacillus malikii]MDQ0233150.1 uncharacterized membrane protein YhaH (DUF805 family) [Metabacillus malikii]